MDQVLIQIQFMLITVACAPRVSLSELEDHERGWVAQFRLGGPRKTSLR